jgi:glyoxylase-like metal-dependent hydrolase (beta-lactamase superfamily II)
MPEINPITLELPFGLGTVNCYLIKAEAGYLLIDTGSSNRRAALERALINAGCQPGNLKLIVLTHGDFDHTGNAAYLRQTFSAPLAMHPDDFGMIERGDMFASRDRANPIFKAIAPVMFRFGKANRVTPDLKLTEGYDLGAYGLNARVISLLGHSRGSIGLLSRTRPALRLRSDRSTALIRNTDLDELHRRGGVYFREGFTAGSAAGTRVD